MGEPHIDVETTFFSTAIWLLKNLVILSRAFNKISHCFASAIGASENFQYSSSVSQLWGDNLHIITHISEVGGPQMPGAQGQCLVCLVDDPSLIIALQPRTPRSVDYQWNWNTTYDTSMDQIWAHLEAASTLAHRHRASHSEYPEACTGTRCPRMRLWRFQS